MYIYLNLSILNHKCDVNKELNQTFFFPNTTRGRGFFFFHINVCFFINKIHVTRFTIIRSISTHFTIIQLLFSLGENRLDVYVWAHVSYLRTGKLKN